MGVCSLYQLGLSFWEDSSHFTPSQVDEHGKFREKNFQRAVAKLATNTLEGQMQDIMALRKHRRKQKQLVGSDLQRIVKMIMGTYRVRVAKAI